VAPRWGLLGGVLVLLAMGCRRELPPGEEPPRVYETADCGAVMRLPGMTADEVARGVFSLGLLAIETRRQQAADWDRAHHGHWVRWRVVVRPRDADMRQRDLVLVQCAEGTGRLMLRATNTTAGTVRAGLQGGEHLRVEGWLDRWGLVTGTSLYAESVQLDPVPDAGRNR